MATFTSGIAGSIMARQNIDGYIQQWLAGDELAFNYILDYYYRRLLVPALKMVSVREDAEELIMNTLLKIWQHKHRLSQVHRLDDYLFGILRQETVRLCRKQVLPTENIENFALNDLGSVGHPEFTLQEIRAQYQEALNKLTPKQREIFLSIREHNISRKEIALQNGMSIHTVNNHMNAALKILRDEMREYPDALVCLLLGGPLFYPFL